MFETWDFVDPKLARRLKQISQQIQQLNQKRTQIIANNRISNITKQKLLQFNDQSIKDLMKILNKHKQSMADYFDTQTTILTKKQVQQIKNNSNTKSCQSNNSLYKINESQQLTKLTFDQDQSSSSFSLNKTRNYLNLNISDRQQKQLKLENLNTTGRFNRKNKYREKQTKSFQLATTNRLYNQSYETSYNKFNALNQSTKKQAYKKRTSINRIVKNRMKKRLAKKSFQLQMQRIIQQDLKNQLDVIKQQSKQDKLLIDLLYKKIQLLQLNKNKEIQEQKKRIQEVYQKQLYQLRRKYLQLNQVQSQNKQLLLKRKQMLKLMQK